MIYFLLPNVNSDIINKIKIIKNDDVSCISYSLSNYLNDIKKKIDNYENDWDSFKKYTNPFEYINTVIIKKNMCISKLKPLSRSYYKMIEIIDIFKLLEKQKDIIQSFHIAEGPGGFIEALVTKRNNKNDKYTGISLLDDKDDNNIPGWKKSKQFLENNPNVFIENGVKKDGNILDIDNFDYIVNKYKNTMNFITADGGFDFSIDFNNQENIMFQLLCAQICFAICLQKKGGCFVLKIFDCFSEKTVDLIYLLSSFYKTVYICKPQTSRYANSEKYVVCKDFLFSRSENYLPKIRSLLIDVLNDDKINRIIDEKIPEFFINKIEEMNSTIGLQQIETINNTMKLIENKNKNEKIENLIKNNIQKSIHWCVKHEVPYNNVIYNSFLSEP
jgi:23S rRNA U2552 (ribose-2'-O)-methylase RlmE/FtsJ